MFHSKVVSFNLSSDLKCTSMTWFPSAKMLSFIFYPVCYCHVSLTFVLHSIQVYDYLCQSLCLHVTAAVSGEQHTSEALNVCVLTDRSMYLFVYSSCPLLLSVSMTRQRMITIELMKTSCLSLSCVEPNTHAGDTDEHTDSIITHTSVQLCAAFIFLSKNNCIGETGASCHKIYISVLVKSPITFCKWFCM